MLLSTKDSPHVSHTRSRGENKNYPERCKRIEQSGQRISTTAMKNTRRADLRAQQSVLPKKANGARDPIFGRMHIFWHSPNPKIQRLQTIPFRCQNSVGVVLVYKGRTCCSLMKMKNAYSLCIIPLSSGNVPWWFEYICSKLSNWAAYV